MIVSLTHQRQVFSALSQISKHSVDLAEMVVEAEVFPAILTSLKGTAILKALSHYGKITNSMRIELNLIHTERAFE